MQSDLDSISYINYLKKPDVSAKWPHQCYHFSTVFYMFAIEPAQGYQLSGQTRAISPGLYTICFLSSQPRAISYLARPGLSAQDYIQYVCYLASPCLSAIWPDQGYQPRTIYHMLAIYIAPYYHQSIQPKTISS